MSSVITLELLQQQNASTSNAIIQHYAGNALFDRLSKYEGDMTQKRDDEDDLKLAQGILFAQTKGVLDPNHKPEPYKEIDVLGKTPDEVANLIVKAVEVTNNNNDKSNDATTNGNGSSKGSVIVLCGLSGTGKGTTVTKLSEQLQSSGHKVVTWSNGNIFRSVTLLAATWCERQGLESFDANQALTKDNIQDYMSMLSFGKYANQKTDYDIRIRGLGLELLVDQVKNTDLKAPKVSKNIPTVAEFTQGEVVLFAAQAVQQLKDDGYIVLLEGRAQTVNYVPSPHRFTLVLSDSSLIGKRRAAQRLMGAAVTQMMNDTNTEDDGKNVVTVLDGLLKSMNDEFDDDEVSPSGVFCVKWLSGGGKKK